MKAILGISFLVAAHLHAKPLQVFILAGQPNMQGHAKVNTFEHIGMDPATKPMLDEMMGADEIRAGKLTAGFGASQNGPKIGPEFTFGLTTQKLTDAPILLIKTTWGGKSLNTDFRPPSAGPYVFNESQLSQLQKQGKDIAAIKAAKEQETGAYYRLMIEHVKTVLADIKSIVPGYDASQGHELAGFAWFQGWNDMVDQGTYQNRDKPGGDDAYSTATAHFIRDVRKDLNTPKLPFVIGVMGVGGPTSDYGPNEQRYKATHQNYFLKAGPDSPETLLAYTDFDGTEARKDSVPLKTWAAHAGDWKAGDPAWKNGRGKNLIAALNYLAGKGVNAFSFLTYNTAGDGDNVWPFIARNDKLHHDCSKLDQWGIVFDHATALGLCLHFKLQENESDGERLGMNRKPGKLSEALDGGKLGIERQLCCRELITRFGHALALNWNIGEENTQSTEDVRNMVKYLHDTDPYCHHIVLRAFPPETDEVYRPLIGHESLLTGISMQTSWKMSHPKTLQWRRESAEAGRPWVVAHDEQNSASLGVLPDPGYKRFSGAASETSPPKGKAGEGFIPSEGYTLRDVRKLCLWGTLMAGSAGVEYYFGYKLPENDLVCEDFRSRDKSWDYCRIALDFFREQNIPIAEMQNANALFGDTKDNNDKYCLAKPGEGGDLKLSVNPIAGGDKAKLTAPDENDWLAVIRRN